MLEKRGHNGLMPALWADITRSDLEPVPRYELSTYQSQLRWLNHNTTETGFTGYTSFGFVSAVPPPLWLRPWLNIYAKFDCHEWTVWRSVCLLVNLSVQCIAKFDMQIQIKDLHDSAIVVLGVSPPPHLLSKFRPLTSSPSSALCNHQIPQQQQHQQQQ